LNKKSRPGAAQQSKIIVAQKLKRSGPDQLILRLASLGPATMGGADGLVHSRQALIGMLDLSHPCLFGMGNTPIYTPRAEALALDRADGS
jgi:hypothetical protein